MNIKIVNFCEIDKYAVLAYSKMHDVSEELNLGDITKIDIESLPQCDLITHGSPCQDFSLAGNGKGADEGSGTRSSLMWNSVEIISQCKPKFVIWENVKNAVGKKHKHNFNKYLAKMHELGYFSYWGILNAKNYGIPQNRERVYCVSIRKDIHDLGFKFPQKIELKKVLRDMLEDKVDEKYYLSEATIKRLITSTYMQSKRQIQKEDICDTLLARDYKDPKCMVVMDTEYLIGAMRGRNPDNPSDLTGGIATEQRLELNHNGTSNALTTVQKDNLVIAIKSNTKNGYEEATIGDSINFAFLDSKTRRGRVGNQVAQTIQCNDNQGVVVEKAIIDDTYPCREVRRYEDVAPTIRGQRVFNVEENRFYGGISTTISGYANDKYPLNNISRCLRAGKFDNGVLMYENNNGFIYNFCIRKLTPKEYWRLMGFKDKDFDRAKYSKTKKQEISNSQLYKMAGNSIVVDVLVAIFKELKKQYPDHMNELDVISLFSGIGAFETALRRVR